LNNQLNTVEETILQRFTLIFVQLFFENF